MSVHSDVQRVAVGAVSTAEAVVADPGWLYAGRMYLAWYLAAVSLESCCQACKIMQPVQVTACQQ